MLSFIGLYDASEELDVLKLRWSPCRPPPRTAARRDRRLAASGSPPERAILRLAESLLAGFGQRDCRDGTEVLGATLGATLITKRIHSLSNQ